MPLFNWTDELSMGIPSIDQEHKQLVDMVNQLHDAMKAGKANEILGPILNKLIQYTLIHFRNEERLFAQHGYPNAKEHMQLHADLTKQVKELQEKLEKQLLPPTLETSKFLKDWLVNHIMTEDKKYSEFLASKGVS